jgi:hypothetical protein
MFLIESRNERNPDWAMSGIGNNNLFTTEADARSRVEELKTLGDEWTFYGNDCLLSHWDTAEYRVVEAQLVEIESEVSA